MYGFPLHTDMILAIAVAAAFALGWMLQRLFKSRRANNHIEQLSDRIARMEQQRDSAHRVSLDLAASHTQLLGDFHEAEWTIRGLKAELLTRDDKIENLLDGQGHDLPSLSDEFWGVEKTVQ